MQSSVYNFIIVLIWGQATSRGMMTVSILSFDHVVGRELHIITNMGTEFQLQVIRIDYNLDDYPVGLCVHVVFCSSPLAGLREGQEVELFATNDERITPEDIITEAEVARYAVNSIGPRFVCVLNGSKIVGFRVRTVRVR